jgi:integrase
MRSGFGSSRSPNTSTAASSTTTPVIRLDAPGDSHQPPPPRYTTQLLEQAIRATVAAVRYDTAAVTCDDNKIRLIKVHHVRHTVGSLLKDLGVPARDAQTILGHTRISTTLEIYTDTDEQARRDALTRLQSLLGETQD